MIEKKKLSFKAIAVAAAINMDGQVVALHVIDGAIDTQAFVLFLYKVGEYLQGRKGVMLVDNLSVHYTYAAKNAATKNKIEMVYNGIYSSEFNPIERLWAWAKARFTRRCS